jgi:hypothetical protein
MPTAKCCYTCLRWQKLPYPSKTEYSVGRCVLDTSQRPAHWTCKKWAERTAS